MWTGAKVVTFSDSWSTLFTGSQLSSLLGRAFDFTRDVVLCYNADNSAAKGYMFAPAAHSDGTIRVYARIWGDYTGTCKGPGRVNWVLIAP